jgi:hypothetical protein
MLLHIAAALTAVPELWHRPRFSPRESREMTCPCSLRSHPDGDAVSFRRQGVMHLLLIEDDLDLGRALQAALKLEGFQLRVAAACAGCAADFSGRECCVHAARCTSIPLRRTRCCRTCWTTRTCRRRLRSGAASSPSGRCSSRSCRPRWTGNLPSTSRLLISGPWKHIVRRCPPRRMLL